MSIKNIIAAVFMVCLPDFVAGQVPNAVSEFPLIKWNMSSQEISKRVDQMIAAVGRSNPIARSKQVGFTQALSKVRDAVVKNDMTAYSTAVSDLAGVTNALSIKEQGSLGNTLKEFMQVDSSCSTSCLFGSCSANCRGGSGGGAACTCVYGFPVCACGGGGKYEVKTGGQPGGAKIER